MKIELAADGQARALLEDPGFLGEWRALAATDPKLTLLQEPEFALPWYRSYAETHRPLLLVGRSATGELVGLLPLAQRVDDGAVSHAGGHQAEYHGWIARGTAPDAAPDSAADQEEFLVRALLELRRTLRFRSWQWRWMPPGSSSRWAASTELRGAGIHAVVEHRSSPVWDLGEREKLEKLLASSAIRSKGNRYRRRGAFRLERILDPAVARTLLPVLARQCDYRQEVIHDSRPFAEDPRKEAFFLERLSFPEANHLSVLLCGSEPIAFHHGACDRRVCLLGLTAFSPAESRHSPGTLLLVELARALAEAGLQRLDLTPGTDPYKLRFANQEQSLTRVALHATALSRLRSRAVATARRAAVSASASGGLRAQEALQRARRTLGLATDDLLAGRIGRLARRGRARLWERRSYALFRLDGALPDELATAFEVRRQAYEELLVTEGGGPFATRRELLAHAQERFSEGDSLYTVSLPASGAEGPRERRLVLLGWRTGAAGGELAKALRGAGLLPEEGGLLHGFVAFERSATPGAFEACVQSMVRDVSEAGGARTLLCLDPRESALCAAAEGLGFRRGGRAIHRRHLGGAPSWNLAGLALPGERA